MRKKIGMYFNLEKDSSDPLAFFGAKKAVYKYFFDYGKKRGLDMFIAGGKNNYLEKTDFKNLLFYTGKTFIKNPDILTLDAIYDRSGGVNFPTRKIDSKTLNRSSFKALCYDKNLMYSFLGEFMPKSFRIRNRGDFEKKLKLFDDDSLVVLKPASGLGGKGIFIDKPEKIKSLKIDFKKEYVLQDFVDTSRGIKGLTKTHHDLRVVIVNGKIVLAHIRTPQEGSLLANASQGGKIKEISLKKIPGEVLKIVKLVQKKIDRKFNFPIYSIDFGISLGEKPFIFELNDQIGFPSPKMKNAKLFIKSIIHSLEKLADIKERM